MRDDEQDDGDALTVRRPMWRTVVMAVLALLGAAVLAGILYTVNTADNERDDALARQSQSYERMILARTAAETMASAEAALGRYVISGERNIGQSYSNRWRRAYAVIQQLQRVTADNPGQRRRADALLEAYRERGQELRRIAWYTQHGDNRAAYAYFNADRRTPALRRLHDRVEALFETERQLLLARSEAARTTLAQSRTITRSLIGFGVLLVLAAIALGWLTMRAWNEREAASAEAADERERSDALQAAVDAATAELREQAAEREAAEARLRQVQKMEAVGQLTGGIAHDFNNMLAVVIGGLELAKRQMKGANNRAERHIDNAMEGANRAAALTRRLLAFARAEPLLPEAIESADLIAGMQDLLERTIGETIAVEVHDAGRGWKIWADRHQLENAILNLAVNARDAMKGSGTLTIETGGRSVVAGELGECEAGDYVTIAVCDTGCGMTPEIVERVFEPFFTTKPVGKGTGLGLSQIFGFVRQSQGEIMIDSIPDAGTTVTLFLPRHQADAPALFDTATAAPAAAPAGPDDALEIIVVEDDERVLAATVSVLEELGHRPTACGDPLAASTMIAAMPRLDCIITDVIMPGRTGPDLIAELAPALDRVGVVFVTGYAGDASDSARFGGHSVLRKPYTINGLAAAIAHAVEAARMSSDRRSAHG